MDSTTDDDYYAGERAFRKPNLQSRLQGGMNLQVCFMNDVPGDENTTPQEASKPPAHSEQVRTARMYKSLVMLLYRISFYSISLFLSSHPDPLCCHVICYLILYLYIT